MKELEEIAKKGEEHCKFLESTQRVGERNFSSWNKKQHSKTKVEGVTQQKTKPWG